MRVNRENFLQVLQCTQAGLAQKETVEQASCFIFRGGRVMTYNGEVSCRRSSGLPPEFEGAVIAAKLLAQLQKFPEEEIDVSKTSSHLILKGSCRKAGINLESEIVLPIDDVERPKNWKDLPESFCDAINTVQHSASQNEDHFFLTCIHIHPKWVEAFDTVQLCRWTIDVPIDEPILVQQKYIKDIVPLGMTQMAETENWVHFRNNAKCVFSCRRHVQDFPELDKYITLDGVKVSLPKALAEAAILAADFSQDNTSGNQIDIHLMPNKLRVHGKGAYGWYRETKKVHYSGESMSFGIAPEMLADIVKRHSECIISPSKLMVQGGPYLYATSLYCLEDVKEEEDSEVMEARR
jgi:hypothetical protein